MKAEPQPVAKVVKRVPRTLDGVRDALFEEWDALRRGEVDVGRVHAVVKISAQLLQSVKVELEIRAHINDLPEGRALPMSEPLKLVSTADVDE